MPSLPWSKSNRSHSSVETSSGHPSPVPSGPGSTLAVNETGASRYPPSEQLAQQQQPAAHQIPAGVPQPQYRQQQPPFPQRATSHRHSSGIALDQQTLQQLQGGPQPPQGYDQQPRRGSYQPQSSYTPEQPKKQGLRSRLGLTSHKEEDRSKSSKVGRRQSVRKSDPRELEFRQQEEHRLRAAQWNQRHGQHGGSSSHLAPSDEHDEDDLDPFLQQEDEQPRVPPKDAQFQQHPLQYSPNPHQEQYNRPPLAKVSTEGSYHAAQGGADHYSPEHQGLQPQQHPPSYQNYQQPPPLRPSNPNDYQAYPPPQNASGPLVGSAQVPPPPQPQQNYYQYQAQQAAQHAQQQSPQGPPEPQVQNPRYSQQSPPSPQQPQPHQGQDFQQLQHGRSPSQAQAQTQAQGEPNAPPPSQTVPQIVQGGQPIDGQHSQQLRPPSSHASLAPPSPLQSQPPTFKPYDQQGQPSPSTDPHSHSVTPPQQDNMAPANSGQRNTLRKVNDGSQQQAPPSRESSLLQQSATQQGQAQGQPPVSPGIQTFGANVVPIASQGQPYRGEKGQNSQSGEMGRATPPPRATADMSDDEIAQLQKDHDVLRDKYQKVKRYFFEQQTQVHQLQNTLANQRLSLSRTSWDDSEYSTRFNRLDGLIAQLSFAIRKDWKAIPPWLQPVVNKTAVETGKQEMTAVGRAFISQWLVENIFDKYFHPDLETGLSTQLKTIQLNIRKYAATCHTTEDEDALNAKVINWRLATLEGLTEQLKAAQAGTNRATLTETLNEKLIASIQMYLNDPAPPDLNGGVPMIVELAISVAQHLPLESREVQIEYFYPGQGLVSEFMKMESGIPALTDPIREIDEADRASLRSVASKLDDNASIGEPEQSSQQLSKEPADKKRSMFGFGGSKKPSQNQATLGKSLGQQPNPSQQSLSQSTKDDAPQPRVRLSVGVAVQIRGKSILIKAPVYST
ncbi:hypothetical protein P171DRAFT_491658 [Karstenula rhodostoma CBS 690.94]|uniref:Uncharacterized protein n=1 Tax=Karstenula rhodostoma CBS 690.94 TaxID=1392251 RepID=A0A9P4P5M0_9PLEO|nr:hypothetical protein P171DRAFT_491658 [Karstenula rhodostoma CBS 690.94]